MKSQLNVYLLAFGAFLTAVAELVVAGILNAIAEDLHISIGVAGQLITAYSLAFAIGTPIVVALTSRWSRKKVLLGALSFFIVGSLLSFGSREISLLIVSRLLLGLSAGVYLVVALGSVAKLVPREQTGRAMSLLALGFSLAIVLGVPLGIAIANRMDWHMIFMLLAIVSLVVWMGLLRYLPEIEGDAPVSMREQFTILKQSSLVSGFAMSLLWSTGNSVMFTYLTPFFNEIYQLSPSQIGIVMLVLGVFGVIGSRFGGYGVDRWGTVRMLAMALAASVISFALLPAVSSTFVIGVGLIALWITSMFVSAPAINTYFVQLAPQSANLVLSLNTSFTHLGLAMGAGAGGLLIDSSSSVLFNPWLAGATLIMGAAAARYSFGYVNKGKAISAME